MNRLTQLVSNRENMAKFSHLKEGIMYYRASTEDGTIFMFPINLNDKDDIGMATFECEIKCITLMRYIRKAIDNNSLIQVNNIKVD